MNYYRILDNIDGKDRWFLGEVNFPKENDLWDYLRANMIKKPISNLNVKITIKGKKLDFTFGEFELVIVNREVADLFESSEVQKIPIKVEGEKESYFILVIKNEIDAIDKEHSDYALWEKDNPIRPDLEGQYKNFFKMTIDSNKVKGNTIFRLKGYDIAIIVNEDFKNRFQKKGLTGIKFQKV